MADKTKVDAFLGAGSWNDWQTLQKDHLAAAKGSDDWNRWFSFGAEADLVWRCPDDIISLDVVGDDYAEVDKLQDQIADRKSLLVTLKGNIRNVEIKCRSTRRKLHNEAEVALLAAGYNLDPLYVNWR